MDYSIDSGPSNSVLEVSLSADEQIVSEAGAMAWMSSNIEVQTGARGGIRSSLGRSVLGGESFFQNTYSAVGDSGQIGLTPGQPGQVIAHEMQGNELMLEKDAYLASEPSVALDTNFQGLGGLFNEGMFVLRASGSGMLFFDAYGDIEQIDVDGDYLVDNGHAVAWDSTLSYSLTRARQIRSFLFSDQLMLKFSGVGKLWVQSRNPKSLANWIYPFRRVEKKQQR
jgi:uncharacterized protein (TIGR00266 family)